jgi:4a-hydroxytetrahydrobiopterin dehydratase
MTNASAYPEGWNEVRGALQRGFRFKDFGEAIAFANRLAAAAEEADHHPDISISWNAVTVRWWTHTKRAITERDVRMARRTDELAAASGSAHAAKS